MTDHPMTPEDRARQLSLACVSVVERKLLAEHIAEAIREAESAIAVAIAAAMRERCAEVAEENFPQHWWTDEDKYRGQTGEQIVKAIRALPVTEPKP